MSDPELVRTLDYILNRCDASAVEAVAAAVIRRKRDLALFGSAGLSDPTHFAKDVAKKMGAGMELNSVRNTVRDLAANMLRKEAPELSDAQIEELLTAWVPGPNDKRTDKQGKGPAPSEAILSMTDQFIAFSSGTMDEEEDAALRAQLGSWPERYWKAFPGIVRSLVTDRLSGRCDDAEFRTKLLTALELTGGKGS